MIKALCSFSIATLASLGTARAGELVAGPMLGYQTHREVALWLETRGASDVQVSYLETGRPETRRNVKHTPPPATLIGTQPQTFVLPLLEMGRTYDYTVEVDGKAVSGSVPFQFKTTTQWEYRTPAPDFSFLFGSCAYINDPAYDRPGEPYGKSTAIFRHMASSGASFMLWAGDNWYYREADFSSASGLWYRASHDRSISDLQPLLGSMHHYATWDDHDYGSNDSNWAFPLKGVTLDVFKSYWPAGAYGLSDLPGVFQSFIWGDATFILMDNRSYRDDSSIDQSKLPTKTQYGIRQREWLKQSLMLAHERKSTFIFVATGGQVITDFGGLSETFALYTQEREEILRFIEEEGIRGVIFLSGDVHFTELARMKLGTRWVYELTSSPLTSGAISDFGFRQRTTDPHRVEGTLVRDQNYSQLSISGPKGARVVTIRCFDNTNQLRWTQEIPEAELRPAKTGG